MITLLVMTDGRRDCLSRVTPTLRHLRGPITRRVIHDDSGDPDYVDWLHHRYRRRWTVVGTGESRRGFFGAYRSAWAWLRGNDDNPLLFSTEDDFVIRTDIDLTAMADVLTAEPHLAQLALRRQPVNADEQAAGGVVEQYPDDYTDRTTAGHRWLAHRRFFTTNPSLVRSSLIAERDWPTGPHSEGRFSLDLFADAATETGFWGARDTPPTVWHLDGPRVGTGY